MANEKDEAEVAAKAVDRGAIRARENQRAELDEAALEKQLHDRFGGYFDEEESEEIDELEGGVQKQALLPTLKDPNLWMIKCKPGTEQAIVMGLMGKFLQSVREGRPLSIKSAVAPEGLKGYFYIEADNEKQVREAMDGTRDVFHSKVTLVPLAEMPEVLAVRKKKIELNPNSWVRLKLGTYKDDIGQVVEVSEAKGEAVVKLVPRLLAGNEKPQRGVKPPARLFNSERATDFGFERRANAADTSQIFWVGGNSKEKYRADGYLYKLVSIRSLVTDGVFPTLEELEKFQGGTSGKGDESALQALARQGQRRQTKYTKGEVVVVIDGDLKGIYGTVLSMHDEQVMIQPNVEGVGQLLFSVNQVQKYFKQGDHVKIIAGRYEGETGLIVSISGTMVTLFSDLTLQEIKCLVQDIQEASEVTSGRLQHGNYELHDLVQLTNASIGVIIRIDRENFQIIDTSGVVHSVPMVEIGRKMNNKNAMTLDSHGNNLSRDDLVQVTQGPAKGKQARVKHIYKAFVFLHSRTVPENSGIFVARARNCELLGANEARRQGGQSATFMPPQSPASAIRGGMRGGRGGGGGRFGLTRQDQALMGKTVVITKGLHKGYAGIIKDATEQTVKISLLSKHGKIVTVNRSDYRAPEEVEAGGPSSDYYTQTPGRTPGRGNETPARGGWATPGHEAFDPSAQPQTPAREEWGSNYNDGYTSFSPYSNPEGEKQPYNYSYTPSNTYTPGQSNFSPQIPSSVGISTPQGMPTPGQGTPGQPHTPSFSPQLPPTTPGLTPSGGFTPYPMTPGNYNLNPASPGQFPATPGAQGFPATPAQGFPATPGFPMTPGGYMGQNFPTTPYAGMAMPNTPQIPSTPRGPESFMPTSPAIEPPASKESQVLAPNVEICFIPTYRSGRFKNNRAFIKEVTRDGMLEVELLQETPTGWVEAGESFTVAQTFVTPAVPALQEKRRVRITKGDDAGKEGQLQQQDDVTGEVIVMLDGGAGIAIVPLHDIVILHK